MKIPEILAPAGTPEALRAAVNAGCDAVYLGGRLFGARAYAGNFDREELLKALEFCHLFGVKVYMTVNTLMKEPEINELISFMEPYYLAGLDGVIVQDVGAVRVLRNTFPDLPLHGSTQMSISSVCGAEFLRSRGLTRVVPARELTLQEICAIRKQVDIEIETFVHGAMCYAYSGKCLFSSFLGGRSGNRGRCAQPCRQLYAMGKGIREYSMSMKDMCTLSVLPKLIDAGIHSFKIEGRMKNSEYVAATVQAYRKARDYYLELYTEQLAEKGVQQDQDDRQNAAGNDHPPVWEQLPDTIQKKYFALAETLTEQMQDIYNRGGFCTGYYEPVSVKSESSGVNAAGSGNAGGTIGNHNEDYMSVGGSHPFRAEKGPEMISRTRPNHTGVPVGRVERIREPEIFVRLIRDVHKRDVLEILPAEVELTTSDDGKTGAVLRLKGKEFRRIKPGMQVFRTRNQTLLEEIDRELLGKEKKITGKARIIAKIGEPLRITITSENQIASTVEGSIIERAAGSPATSAVLEEKMKKTGGTHVELDVECELDEQAFVPMSMLNELRRKAVEAFKEAVCRQYCRHPDCENGSCKPSLSCLTENTSQVRQAERTLTSDHPFFLKTENRPLSYYRVRTKDQLEMALRLGGMQVLLLDDELAANPPAASSLPDDCRIYLCLPDVARESRSSLIRQMVQKLPESWGLLIRNPDELGLLQQMNYQGALIGDSWLYAYNSQAIRFYLEVFSQMQFICSDELTDKELESLGVQKNRMIMKAYGYQPLMISNQCLNRNYSDCREKIRRFTDGRGEQFFVLSHCRQCCSTVYNGKSTWMADRIGQMGYSNILFDFTMENAEDMQNILWQNCPGEYTRGHHYRGIE